MQANPDTLRLAVRVCHHAGGNSSFGTGVFITPTAILTARHVLDPLQLYRDGRQPLPGVLHVETTASLARPIIESVRFPDAADIDLGLAMVAEANAVDPAACMQLHRPGSAAFSVGDELAFMGFSSAAGAAQADHFTVLGGHPDAGCYIANRSVPEGYSGGPVTAGGALAGVVYMRHQTQGQAYFYGLEHVHAFLISAGIAPALYASAPDGLLRYPLGPYVPRNTVHTRLYAVIAAYVDRYQGQHAKNTVYLANAARQACGPDTGAKGVVDVNFLTNPDIDAFAFWNGAFCAAGLKSPRMLAALLLTADDDVLPPAARAQRAAMLGDLAAWKG